MPEFNHYIHKLFEDGVIVYRASKHGIRHDDILFVDSYDDASHPKISVRAPESFSIKTGKQFVDVLRQAYGNLSEEGREAYRSAGFFIPKEDELVSVLEEFHCPAAKLAGLRRRLVIN